MKDMKSMKIFIEEGCKKTLHVLHVLHVSL